MTKTYFNSSSKTCESCDYPCLTCTDSGSKVCITCISDNREDAPGCACKSGYYEEDNICKKC